MLALAKFAAQGNPASDSNSHAAPSGMKPTHLKPSTTGKRKKKPGRKPGHVGTRRPKPPPERVNAREEHQTDCCPNCGGPLNPCAETRLRYIEDIPQDLRPVVTEHVIHRDWCPQCQKKVEPPVADALRGSPLGHRVLVLTAWLHYALGNTLAQIIDVLGFHLQFRLTRGGLLQMWYRLQEVLYPWYEQIQRDALASAVLHADETGWRVNGKTHWLWCFTTPRLTYYMIHRSRGHPALLEFFISEFAGILVSDFWGAYNAVACALRQTCLVHLLRDLKQVEKYKSTAHDWPAFAKLLRRLLGDAIRLWRLRGELPAETYASRCAADAALGGVDRDGLAQRRVAATDQAPATAPSRLVYVSRSRWSPVRQQPRGARGASGSDHPQEQLRQPERSRRRCAGGVDDHIPHAQTTRSPTDANDRSSLENLRPHRTIAATPSIATSDG